MKLVNSGALRHARAVVTPRIPALGIELSDNKDAIRDAVRSSLAGIDIDPTQFSDGDITKTAKHAIAGYFIGEQRCHLVQGRGRDATFHSFDRTFMGRVLHYGLDPRFGFSRDIGATLRRGARAVESTYTNGDDAEHQTWPVLEDHYKRLGWRAVRLAREDGFSRLRSIPAEGLGLKDALRTQALSSAVISLSDLVKKEVEGHDERVAAAHDLAFWR